ncbi:hypothetical protein C7974DRAFT_374602 [Boeremia exigua]|uniref:uncharacterized protein n=1 Tax=Boeremia exigua TaxID=749465 RepID=UPI001E8EB63B|nr:uncharacterized protein C7974DRAFT_374602 [Boeremia exigua]KAH6637995.1 hypothetical protein C7974DRAFT_374602 [Boeremia exigua]
MSPPNTPTFKITKPTRRLCDRRLARTHDATHPPKYHLRTRRDNPALAAKLAQMRLPIAPIVHLTTGLPGPCYPHTLLHLFTLTEPQLDALAAFYSQTSPSEYSNAYPQTMDWGRACLSRDPGLPEECRMRDLERLKVKMRMFARFVGMRGAETPGWEVERQVELLGRRIRRVVRGEGKGWGGLDTGR